MLDQQARHGYRQRLADLSEELEEAVVFHDGERATLARLEIDALIDQLAGGVGLSGRSRVAASNAERARVSVTRRSRRL